MSRHTRTSKQDGAARELRLECRLLFFRHCARTHTTPLYPAQSVNVGRNIQLASKLIVEQVERGQIDEIAELLGQFTCAKRWNVSKTHKRICMMGYTSCLGMHCDGDRALSDW